jgi:MYXO-CTERM domain-containing protein
MRSIRSAGAVLTLAGIATFAGSAVPAFAAGPQIDVTPAMAAPGSSVTFSIVCISGKSVGTSATLFGTTIGLSEHIPMGPATHKGVFVTTVRLPSSIMPGKYSPSVDCSNGLSGTGSFQVVAAVKPAVVVPSGAPVTGDGVTSTAMGSPMTAAGLGLLGLSGLVGVFAIRRRKANANK